MKKNGLYDIINEENVTIVNGKKTTKIYNSTAKIYNEFEVSEEMVDADVNVEIEVSNINTYSTDEKVDAKQLKQLEDDRNSSTGNV